MAYDLYAPNVIVLMRAAPLRGQVGGGWALEVEIFLGPVKWHRAVRRVPFRVPLHPKKIIQEGEGLKTGTCLPQVPLIGNFQENVKYCIV
jgi:hypothetical protein